MRKMIKDIISNNKKKAEILLVEDSHAQALKLKYLLKEHGFSCVLAKNGWEALSKTKENKPDLIISDIVMPEMDGYELCRNLKTDNILKNIPVILLTALTGTENIIKGLNVNSDFYITKPYEENFLLSKINFLLSKKITGQSDVDEELEIVLNGKLHKISANKKQILNFLVSTHENLVFQNQALTQTQKALKKLNENLEEKVKEKTAHLLTEITERKQTEEALRESEEKFDAMLRSIGDHMSMMDKDLNIIWANETAKKIFGDDIIGKKCFEVYHKRKEPCKPYPCLTLKSFQDGKIHKHDTQVIDSNGKIWYFHCTANVALRDKDGKPVAVIEISKDITERKQTEEALCKSEEKYRMLYDSSTDAIMLATPEEGFLSGNTAAIKIFGCKDEKEFTSQTPHNLSPLYQPDGTLSSVKVKRMMAIAMKKGSHFFEWTHKRMDGQEFYATVLLTRMELQGKRMLQAIVRDITKRKRAEEERKKLEDRLSQTQKMEAIGVLAGGIAHDFNNILTPVLGFTELALFDVPAGSKTHKNLNEVLNAGQRAKNLVKQILTFSRQSEEKQREPIRTSLIIKEVLKLLQAVIPSTIEIRQNIAPDTHVVNADPTKIHQILMNLCSNAGHAMPEGGVLEISLVNVDLDEKICAELEDLTAGSYIRLTVKDTGCGMDKKTLTRIFDPFFTTKAPGEGTGLGLSVVHGIVKSHGGNIVVQSKPGIGTTFHIYLPVAELIAKAQPETTEQFRGGTESILFIDDEAMIVDMFAMILKQFGYRVTTRSSGVEALELFRFKPDEFDLVITDQTMPKLTGSDLALELLRIRPDIPIILCTGFSHTITPEKARAMGIRAFVMKPVVGTELGRTIRQVLD